MCAGLHPVKFVWIMMNASGQKRNRVKKKPRHKDGVKRIAFYGGESHHNPRRRNVVVNNCKAISRPTGLIETKPLFCKTGYCV